MGNARFMADEKAHGESSRPVQVDLEKVTFYEIDTGEDETHVLTEEEEASNSEFLQKSLIPELTKRVKVCDCRMQDVLEKNMRRAKLMNLDPRQMTMTLDQSDIDACKFGVIVTSKNGVYDGIACITVECASCRKIDIYGDASNITTLIANNLVHTYKSDEDGLSMDELLGEDAILEDIEDTNEVSG